ncbi:MAG: hypothetical protein V3R25_10270 [Nitrosomonadaceae bacterium]
MVEKYEIKLGDEDWKTVSKEEWIKRERQAGFLPRLSRDHPDYMTTCATGGFGGGLVSGRITHINF